LEAIKSAAQKIAQIITAIVAIPIMDIMFVKFAALLMRITLILMFACKILLQSSMINAIRK